MSTASIPPHADMGSAHPHPNPVVHSLQILLWLGFHPSAWRLYLTRIDPVLRPDFCLAELPLAYWWHPILRGLLARCLLIWPSIVGCLLLFALWLMGIPAPAMVYGALYGAMVCAATTAMGCVVITVAGGIVAGVLGGLVSGVARGIVGEVAFGTTIDVLGSAVACGVAGGAISVAAGVASWDRTHTFSKQLGSIFIGILTAGLVAGGVIFVLRSQWPSVPAGIATGGVAGSVIGIAIWLRTQRWRRGIAFGVAAACVAGVAHSVVISGVGSGAASVAGGIAASVICSALFMLPYTLAGRLGGPWAGGIAGALGGGSWLTFVLIDTAWFPFFVGADVWRLLPYNVLGTVLGLTQTLWRPLVTYPLQSAWSTCLYYLEAWQTNSTWRLLPWHPVFWDEWQRLPLPLLDAHLVLLTERDSAEGQAALAAIAQSRQRWAAQAAQIELDARLLSRCQDIDAISAVRRHFASGEIAGPASAILRSFGRISEDVYAAQSQASTYHQRLLFRGVEERLDSLLGELTRSSESYAARFRPIAVQWRQHITAYIAHLTAATESRQEIDSPYVLGVPLIPQQDIFVGRLDIGARLEQLLIDRRRPPLLLYGQRRMGKTSLLNNLSRLLPSTIIPLFVDLQGPASQSRDHAGFLYNISRGMAESALRQKELMLPPLSRDALAGEPFTRFDEWLDEIEQRLAPHTVLLALDEFETLDDAILSGRLNEAAVFGMLRHLIQHRPRFTILFAGSHTFDELQRWASYLVNVQIIHVGYLHETEARQLIVSPVPNFPLRYEPDACQRVIDLTGCHPALVQLLCAEIVALKNEQPPIRRRLACLSDVEAAVPGALCHGSLFFADIARNQVDVTGRTLLHFLARQGEKAVVSKAVLNHILPQGLDAALNLLRRRELIDIVDGGYCFQVELIRRWFAQEHT